VSPRPYCLGYL
jgi:DNA end-binding protein Ku